MKNTKNFLFIVFLLVIGLNLSAQNRVQKPIQIHLNWSGVFLKVFANSIADSEVQNLEVKKWGIPGISIGYHLNKRLYIGYSFQPNRNLILSEEWSFSGSVLKDGFITVDHKTGAFHNLESRYFPFKFGFYGSLFLNYTSKANYEMDFIRSGSTMQIGANSYSTDINANWNFKFLSTLGIGLGYNYVHKSGFSFDLNIGVPIPLNKPFHENIVIESVQGINIQPFDLNSGINQIENEMFYYPVQLNINLGYNFVRKNKED